ncbi:ATP-grasp domain-containing protein [Salegentibacter sp. JZCK2]|uniref:glutathione synthetase n=1 Tax=Salegentibacter tibetensis TaxID=2873600 RepID=UPI001CCDD31B|nr:glutathione synthetase [Salegentibacter tibetensis]MBZ9729262.1 ATP-grasp domain-containing protein [Salegentibacter tibetensis]
MKICFVLNDIETESSGTSVMLMTTAHARGHEVYAMGVGDFNFHHDAPISINSTQVPKNTKTKSPNKFLEALQSSKARKKTIAANKMDVLFIRNNPTEEDSGREWAEQAGIAFGRMIQQEGVLVLNDAYALSHAFIDKLYFEELPQEIKPDSLITRNKEDILKFWEKNDKKIVLKPLEGSGGQNVFLIDENEKNINQIIETISQQGYVIAQEFLPAVKDGDVRIILMNGRVMVKDGKQAIIRRVSGEGEFRSNFALGATADSSELTPEMQRIVDLTAPKLIRDGLFFVGLDVVKDKLIEINVLSPGGMEHFKEIGLPDFTDTVIEAIERKVEYKALYGHQFDNREIACME